MDNNNFLPSVTHAHYFVLALSSSSISSSSSSLSLLRFLLIFTAVKLMCGLHWTGTPYLRYSTPLSVSLFQTEQRAVHCLLTFFSIFSMLINSSRLATAPSTPTISITFVDVFHNLQISLDIS